VLIALLVNIKMQLDRQTAMIVTQEAIKTLPGKLTVLFVRLARIMSIMDKLRCLIALIVRQAILIQIWAVPLQVIVRYVVLAIIQVLEQPRVLAAQLVQQILIAEVE
jgi:hypothetical protein